MSAKVKKIGVLTSGGDAPGMNAAIRAVVRTALYNDIQVMGIYRGYNGLISGDMQEMNLRSVSDIIQLGGTVLYTARCKEFETDEGVEKARAMCEENGIEGLVVIGGDGSFRGARDLSRKGIPCVGVPGTIDNDIACSDYTIGYDTAMNTAIQLVDKIRDTCQSHDRCSVVEVMGRHAGHIALNTGIAVGATAIIVPEYKFDLQKDIISRIHNTQQTGKKHFIIIVAEGVGHVSSMAKEIEAITGIETRATILGHVQRGGSPSIRDRVNASEMGSRAVNLLKEGIGNRVVALKNGIIVDFDIEHALNMTKNLDGDLYRMALELSI